MPQLKKAFQAPAQISSQKPGYAQRYNNQGSSLFPRAHAEYVIVQRVIYKSKIRLIAKWLSRCELDDTAIRCWSGLMHCPPPPTSSPTPPPLPSIHTKYFQTGRIRLAERGHIHAIVCCTPVASITLVIFLFLSHQQPFPLPTQQQYLAQKILENPS